MKVVKKSQFQLKDFNNCVPEMVIDMIKSLPFKVNIVDTDKQFWVNCYDTLVFEIDMNKVKKENMNKFALFVFSIGSDEFGYTDIGNGKFIYRFWWN